MPTRLASTWSLVRFTTGMAILSAVFVVSQGLVLVHDLAGATSAGTEAP